MFDSAGVQTYTALIQKTIVGADFRQVYAGAGKRLNTDLQEH
jgi:hypothetical protein